MSCFKEHVKYYFRRVIVLLTIQLQVRKSLHSIPATGKSILELFYAFVYTYTCENIHAGVWSNFCMDKRHICKGPSMVWCNSKLNIFAEVNTSAKMFSLLHACFCSSESFIGLRTERRNISNMEDYDFGGKTATTYLYSYTYRLTFERISLFDSIRTLPVWIISHAGLNGLSYSYCKKRTIRKSVKQYTHVLLVHVWMILRFRTIRRRCRCSFSFEFWYNQTNQR